MAESIKPAAAATAALSRNFALAADLCSVFTRIWRSASSWNRVYAAQLAGLFCFLRDPHEAGDDIFPVDDRSEPVFLLDPGSPCGRMCPSWTLTKSLRTYHLQDQALPF
jgi:hypothetical protein